jgi:hypothetical protein
MISTSWPTWNFAGGLIWGFARPDQGLRLVNSRGGELYADLVSFPKSIAAGDRLFGDLPAFSLSICLEQLARPVCRAPANLVASVFSLILGETLIMLKRSRLVVNFLHFVDFVVQALRDGRP